METSVSAPLTPTPPATGNAKPRYVGIDLVKILACILVTCIHFFLYSGFYSTPITAEFGQIQIYLRWIAYCCVPLFMITTGYLMKNKTLSKKYFLGILRVLIIYLLISIICYAFDFHHYPAKYNISYGGYNAWGFISGLFMFTDAQYAWYVEYYFCIFLILPFLNAAFNGMKSKKHKLFMVVITALITIVSQSLYIGITRSTQFHLIPGYFTRCYPIAYYLIGAYIRDYPPKRTLINKFFALAFFIGALMWVSTTTFQQSLLNTENNNVMMSWHYNDYGSWPIAVCSTMLFLLLFDIRSSNRFLTRVIQLISESTFACYLISYVFDTIFYSLFCQKYLTVQERCAHAYEVIPKVFLCSMGCAIVIQSCYQLGETGIRKMISAFRKKNSDEAEPKTTSTTDAQTDTDHPMTEKQQIRSIAEQIRDLKQRLDQGELTQEEFEKQKHELLKS